MRPVFAALLLVACGSTPPPELRFEAAREIPTGAPVRALAAIDNNVVLAFERPGSVALYTSDGLTPQSPIVQGPRALAVMGEQLIVANTDDRSLAITSADLTLTATVALGAAPLDVSASSAATWVLTGPLAEQVRIWRFDASFGAPIITAVPGAEAISAAKDQLAISFAATDEAAILRGEMLERFETCDEPRAVALADLDLDAENELIVACGSGGIDVIRGAERRHYANGARVYDLIAADLDADGSVDLAAVDFLGNAVLVWRNDGAGELEAVRSLNVDDGPIALVALDLDQDGRLDLAVSAFESRSLDLLIQRKGDE